MKPIVNSFNYIPTHQIGFREIHTTNEQTHRHVSIISETFERNIAQLYLVKNTHNSLCS